MSEPAVLLSRQEHALKVTINRPESMNAVNADVATLLGEALEEADNDPNVRAVVITGKEYDPAHPPLGNMIE